MRPSRWPRVLSAVVLASVVVMTAGCGDMLRKSVKDGLLSFVVGSVSSGFDASAFGDFITSVFTGGFGGSGRK